MHFPAFACWGVRVSALALLVLFGVAAFSGSITVTEPWGRATPGGATGGVGYMTISNRGSKPIRLLGGTTVVAEAVEIHTMTMDGGVMRMRPLSEGVEAPAGGSVESLAGIT